MNQTNPLKEQPQKDETLEAICSELERTASNEAPTPEDAPALLADEDWLTRHLDRLLISFDLNNGARTMLAAQVRKKYASNGIEE
jgi:hypothetical protein